MFTLCPSGSPNLEIRRVVDVNNMAETEPISCAVCTGTENLKRCGYCKQSFYCSRDHQMKDWPKHKTACHKKIAQSKDNKLTNQNGTDQNSNVENTANIINITPQSSDNIKLPNESVKDNFPQNADDQSHITDPGIEFDKRPFKKGDFLKMTPKASVQHIAKVAVETLKQHGSCVIDGVFTQLQIHNALKDIDASREGGKFQAGRLSGGRTSGEQDKQVVNIDIRGDEIFWVEGYEDGLPGVRDIVSTMDSILVAFNDYLTGRYFINGRTKAMLACYPGNGTYYRRHVDNPNRDGRVVTCILYLNEHWDPQTDGGVLRVFPSDTDMYIDVAPLANRLLFFWSDRRNPHEVQPAFKTRYAITVWYMDEKERKQAKQDLAKEEKEQSERRGEYKLECCRKEKADLSKKIEDAAEQAVASLSLDELQAISAVLAGRPDPESVLGQLGIEPHIFGKLLEKLENI